MSEPDTQTTRITAAFATPIATTRVAAAEQLNAALVQLVLAAERASPSTRRSNIGGWRSPADLLDRDDAPIVELRTHILRAVLDVVKATAGATGFQGRVRLSGWANVLRRGNYNAPHTHPESAWSGVYYAEVGDATQDSLSGVLELTDPRPQADMVVTPGKPFGRPLRVQPEAGLIVLFPSWLSHFVHAYTGERARISIAFNASMSGADAPGAVDVPSAADAPSAAGAPQTKRPGV